MPEYLAPGVYVEETSFRTKSIEGVSTSTCGFVGPTRFGPVRGEPELLTSFADFERIYGGLDQMVFEDADGEASDPADNYLAHGVRAFFAEGGKRLYVSRVYNGEGGEASASNSAIGSLVPSDVTLTARFPGRAGNMRVTFVPRLSPNVYVPNSDPGTRTAHPLLLIRVKEHDTVLVKSLGTFPDAILCDVVRQGDALELRQSDGSKVDLSPEDQVFILTVDTVVQKPVERPKRPKQRYNDVPEVLEGFAFHPRHPRGLMSYYTAEPSSRRLALTVPFQVVPGAGVDTGWELAMALLGSNVVASLTNDSSIQEQRQVVYLLSGGSDGSLPGIEQFEGESGKVKSGLAAFEDIEHISIVAAPGYSKKVEGDEDRSGVIDAVQGAVINHCHKMRYRVAVLDSRDDETVGEALDARARIDSTHGAVYYPWVKILDPVTEDEINLPPSGFVSGIYARNDVERGVHKAPANEVVRSAIGFELLINKSQQDVLNPEGVNCFRFFPGRGFRLWGARTVSSDPEWIYLNVRRYFAYLEHSVDRGTQWVVFEPNNESLWAKVRRTVEDFLFTEWRNGRLMGSKPEEAYFVRCDRSTMTQQELDTGKLIVLVGVAPVKPAEYVIFRIGQWTAERKS